MATIDSVDITSLLFQEGSAPSTPASTKWRLYFKTDGLYAKDDAGTEIGPFAASAGAATFHGCKVYNSTTQNVTTSTDTQLTFDSEDVDSDAYHSTASNTDRITVPSGLGGYYLLRGHTTWNANSSGDRIIVFRKNGSDIRGSAVSIPASSASIGIRMMTSCVISAVATDYFQINTFQTSGTTRAAGGSGGDASVFEATLIAV